MQSITRHYHSEMNEVSGLLRIIIYSALDTMPSLGMITINALVAADSVLIPVESAYLSVKGLQQLIKTIGRVKRQLNRNLMGTGYIFLRIVFRYPLRRQRPVRKGRAFLSMLPEGLWQKGMGR